MQAWQHVQLTDTNQSCGLIIHFPRCGCVVNKLSGIAEYSVVKGRSLTSRCSGTIRLRASQRPGTTGRHLAACRSSQHASGEGTPDTKFPGGHRSRVTPVPIPNTEVKPVSADGTACVGAWESRSLPGFFNKQGLEGHTSSPFACTPHHAPFDRSFAPDVFLAPAFPRA